MPRRRSTPTPASTQPHIPPVLDWVVSEELTANGRQVTPGTELTISGEGSTRFVFVRHVRRPSGVEWIDVLETYKGTPQAYRSFRPDRIRTVHRIARTRTAAKAA